MKLRPLLAEEHFLRQLMPQDTLDRIIHHKKQMIVQRTTTKEDTGVEFNSYVITARLVWSLQYKIASPSGWRTPPSLVGARGPLRSNIQSQETDCPANNHNNDNENRRYLHCKIPFLSRYCRAGKISAVWNCVLFWLKTAMFYIFCQWSIPSNIPLKNR